MTHIVPLDNNKTMQIHFTIQPQVERTLVDQYDNLAVNAYIPKEFDDIANTPVPVALNIYGITLLHQSCFATHFTFKEFQQVLIEVGQLVDYYGKHTVPLEEALNKEIYTTVFKD